MERRYDILLLRNRIDELRLEQKPFPEFSDKRDEIDQEILKIEKEILERQKDILNYEKGKFEYPWIFGNKSKKTQSRPSLPPLPAWGTPERIQFEREQAQKYYTAADNKIYLENWVEHERKLKRQRIMEKTKHKTLRSVLFGLRDLGRAFYESGKGGRDEKEYSLITLASQLYNAGILVYTETPEQLPENERKIAKEIIQKYLRFLHELRR